MLSRYLKDLNENFKNRDPTLPPSSSSSSSPSILQTLESHLSPFSYSPPKISSHLKTSPKKSREEEMSSPLARVSKATGGPEGEIVAPESTREGAAAIGASTGMRSALSQEEEEDLNRKSAKEVTDRILARGTLGKTLERWREFAELEAARKRVSAEGAGAAVPPHKHRGSGCGA